MRLSFILTFFSLSLTQVWAQSEFNLNKTYPISELGQLEMNTDDAVVTIKGSDRTDVSIKVYRKVTGKQLGNKKFDFNVDASDGNIKITDHEYKDSNTKISIQWNSETIYTIDIEVPRSVNLDLVGDDDDYNISSISGNLALTVEDGSTEIRNFTGESIDIEIEDGDIDIQDANCSIELTIEDGDFQAKNSDFKKLNIKTEDGDISMRGSKIFDGRIRSSDGDIDLDIALSPETRLDIRTDDGNVDLNTRGPGGKYEVTFEDGDVDFSKQQFNTVKETRNSYQLASKSEGNVDIIIDVEDGDVDLNHSSK